YEEDYRSPTASINFITAHDGFTLNDLVSYNKKHNEANLENNNDGENHNRSWNCGIEGDTDDPEIIALRDKQRRNFFTTLFFSQGVPMIVAGDELGRTQKGNNNAYCQDNETSWIDWQNADQDFLTYTKKLIHFCKRHPVFNRRRWFKGQHIKGIGLEDIAWFQPDGVKMDYHSWNQGFAKSLGVYLNGRGIHSVGPKGEQIVDDNFYLIFNAHHEAMLFKLPPQKFGARWIKILDTNSGYLEETGVKYKAGKEVNVESRSVVLMKNPI
ncbi:MAG: glycogen debranching enzyme GlgX, partial [Bacteroidota bacterium]|nr:glycogen debranching enzyme GlgX [Bacteroidota bacterium]